MTNTFSPHLKAQLRLAQTNELTEYHIYLRLSKRIKNEANAAVLRKIGEEEMHHHNVWRKYTEETVTPKKFHIQKYYWLSLIFGITFGIKLMEKGEENAQINYTEIARYIPEAAQIAREEEEHERQLIGLLKEDKLKYIGSIVLGLNDALVEILGTLAGLTFALQNTRLVALAGIITGIAGALSMSSSEYLSNKSEGNQEGALKSAFFTGLAYFFAVIFLILPYLLIQSPFVALIVAVIDSVLIVFLYSYYISVANDQPFKKRFLEMVVLSTVVGLISFGLGYLVRILFGINI